MIALLKRGTPITLCKGKAKVKQQARFRVLEVQMERRKLELMLQTRRGDAARRMGPAAPVKTLDPSTTATSSKQIRVP